MSSNKNKESAVIKWLRDKDNDWTTVSDGKYTYHFKKNNPFFNSKGFDINDSGCRYTIPPLRPRDAHKISGKALDTVTWFEYPVSGKIHNHERGGNNLYHVTYYYLATGMEGHADEKDYGYWWADSEEEARELASNGDSFVKGCLWAKLTPNNTIPANNTEEKN